MTEEFRLDFVMSEIILADDQLKAIGCIALESTALESCLEKIINNACSFDEKRSEIFIGQLMIGAKSKIMRDLLWPQVVGTKHEPEFQLIYGEIRDLISKRNVAVHGEWNSMAAGFMELATRNNIPSAKKRGSTLTLKATEIMELAHRFDRCQNRLLRWYAEFLASSQPSLENLHDNT